MIKIQNRSHKAFTMLELIFVIVIMGILGKFGVEFLAQAYKTFIYSSINHTLQSNSESAVEFVSTRLQHRIKASTIARETNASISPQYTLLSEYYNTTAPILEWIGTDIDGFRGNSSPFWSGIIDLNTSLSNSTKLFSPATETNATEALINILSNNTGVTQNNMAIYFVNPDALPNTDGWGWDGNITRFNTQTNVEIHPVKVNVANIREFIPINGNSVVNNFSGVTAFEYYQLAWSAYAVGITDWNSTTSTGTLKMWYDYQPWKGEKYTDATTKTAIIMENVSSFRFIASDSVVKIQVCVKSNLIENEEYSLCKEKTIF